MYLATKEQMFVNVKKCGMIGSIVASEIISHIGPRPIKNLKELIQYI